MSKVPVPRSRLAHDSPPVKSRKALDEVTEKINHSPKFRRKLDRSEAEDEDGDEGEMTGAVHKMEIQKTRRVHRTSGIPMLHSSQLPQQIKDRVRSLSEASSGLKLRDREPNTSRFALVSTQTHQSKRPWAMRDSNLELRLNKLVQVEQEKIRELDKKIKDARHQNEGCEKQKTCLMRNISRLKTEISNTEVGIINIDEKMESMKLVMEKEKAHEEHMVTLKLKEAQNQMLRELDEFKSMMEQELQTVKDYKDEESQAEIVKLKRELDEISDKASHLRQERENRIQQERESLQLKLDDVVTTEQKKGEQITQRIEDKMTLFTEQNEELGKVQEAIKSITDRIKSIESENAYQMDIRSNFTQSHDELISKINTLQVESDSVDSKLATITQQKNDVHKEYQNALQKLCKERHFRRKIENSIEDMVGKHRVYVQVPTGSHVEDVETDPSLQQLVLDDGSYYQFNKVFIKGDELMCQETCSLMENLFNGCNVSLLLIGDDDNTSNLLGSMVNNCWDLIQDVEHKFKQRGWNFDYSVQSVNVDPNGVFDLFDSSPCAVKVENRSVMMSTEPREFTKVRETCNDPDSSTLMKLTLKSRKGERNISSNAYFLDLTRIDALPLVSKAIDKVQLLRFGTLEFENPMYQLVHQLYSNTKVITMINVDRVDNEKWLDLGQYVQTVDVVPVNRVYSK